MNHPRNDTALLAGVCARIAHRFGWNVWALRALCVVLLLIKTLWAILAYAVMALVLYLIDGESPLRSKSRTGLASPELAGRSRRIADLERRFEELQRGG